NDLTIRTQRFEASFPTSGSLGGGKFVIVVAEPDDCKLQMNVVYSSDRTGYRVPQWSEHKNGALTWRHVYCVIPDDDFDAVNSFFADAHRLLPRWVGNGRTTFDPGQVRVHLMSISSMAYQFPHVGYANAGYAHIAGFGIEVTSINKLEKLLSERGVAFHLDEGTITVGPSETAGSVIVFSEDRQA
ncbi:MAG: hypothetical protein HC938_17840, partial [Nitrospira sp.]|nr:hypothetical protein [Nitrospira sp.]